MEATFRFVPRFEPVVDEFDQVVTDVILKTLHPNVFDIREIAFDRNSVSIAAVADNGRRVARMCNMAE